MYNMMAETQTRAGRSARSRVIALQWSTRSVPTQVRVRTTSSRTYRTIRDIQRPWLRPSKTKSKRKLGTHSHITNIPSQAIPITGMRHASWACTLARRRSYRLTEFHNKMERLHVLHFPEGSRCISRPDTCGYIAGVTCCSEEWSPPTRPLLSKPSISAYCVGCAVCNITRA